VSHGLDTVAEVVILAVREVLMQEDLALELEAAQEGVALEVGLVLHEDVVLKLRSSHPSMENIIVLEKNFTLIE
jgi:hypothetical protein